MHELERIIDELGPQTIVELGSDDLGESWADRLAPQARAVVGLRREDGGDGNIRSVTSAVTRLSDPIDLVIEHWPHIAEPIPTLFEAVFPQVRPAGVYVMEGAVPPDLVLKLMVSTAESNEILQEVTFASGWTAVRRGPADADAEGFRVATLGPLDRRFMKGLHPC